jgi:hypothetical protein
VILIGQKALEAVLQVVAQAEVFCYIISPWFSSKIALEFKNKLKCPTCVVIVRDYFEENVKSYHIFKGVDFRVDPEVHDKLLITEKACVSGSENFTEKGFLRNHGHYSIRPSTDPEYTDLKMLALAYIKCGMQFDEKHSIIYWSNRNRPLESLPEVLGNSSPETATASSEEADGPDEEEDLGGVACQEPQITDEEAVPEKSSEESRANLSEAWRILLGKKKR